MAADFFINIEMRGSNDEVLEMLKVLRRYETEKHEQYVNSHDCEYIEGVRIGGARDDSDSSGYDLEEMSDDELIEFIEENGCEIYADASGPWGRFSFLDEIGLFIDMADTAPNAEFEGSISGFNTGGDQDAEFKLVDGLLHCRYAIPGDNFAEYDDEDEDDWDDDEYEELDWTSEETYNPLTKKTTNDEWDRWEE
jgi:hypothetical protein